MSMVYSIRPSWLAPIALGIFTLTVNQAFGQETPVEEARAAGLYGIEPDLSRQAATPTTQKGHEIAWNQFGIYFNEYNGSAFVAALAPNGAAASQGAKVGDIMRGSDKLGANKNLRGILDAFAMLEDRRNPEIELYVFDADSGFQREYTLTAAHPGHDAPTVPAALRGATSHAGLMAIVRGEPDTAAPDDIVHDAMLALQAISHHVNACYGPDPDVIHVQINWTETTRDGFGIIRDQDHRSYITDLRVRPEFADWARSNIRMYRTEPISTVRSAVLDLISQQGCDGPGFRQLENGLAKVMGVKPPHVEITDSPEGAGVLPENADAFIAACYPARTQSFKAQGLNMGERSIARICVCAEHAARETGDVGLYESVKVADTSPLEADPDLKAEFDAAFDDCYRAPEGSELRESVEALWRKMRI